MKKVNNIEKIVDMAEKIKEYIEMDECMDQDSKDNLMDAINEFLDCADEATDAEDEEDYDNEEEDSDEDM